MAHIDTAFAQPARLHEKIVVLSYLIIPTLAALVAAWQITVHFLGTPTVQAIDVWLLVVGYFLTMFGVSIGLHRLLTHQAFTTHPVLKFIFVVLGAMSVQGKALNWATDHTEHHKFSDKDGDPHSPKDGFWHSHIGWIRERGFTRNIHPKFQDDAIAAWVDKTLVFWIALGLIIPLLINGLSGLLWGGLVRIFLMNQVTYSVNSVCHIWGYRNFDTDDRSRNNLVLALLTPEAFHNNHHGIAYSANHGMRWWELLLDPSAWIIKLMEISGLARNVKWTGRKQMERRQKECIIHQNALKLKAEQAN